MPKLTPPHNYCLDFYRYNILLDGKLDLSNTIEPLIIGAMDTALAMQQAESALNDLGLGGVVMGAFRKVGSLIAEELKLPEYVFPLAGLAIGKSLDNNKVKPRIPNEISVFEAEYNVNAPFQKQLQAYADIMLKYTLQSGREAKNWIETFKDYYGKRQYQQLDDETKQLLKAKGFIK